MDLSPFLPPRERLLGTLFSQIVYNKRGNLATYKCTNMDRKHVRSYLLVLGWELPASIWTCADPWMFGL